MKTVITYDEVAALLRRDLQKQSIPYLVAIDGRPCSGKTTLTMMLSDILGATTFHLDDFYLPQTEWSKNIQPSFPFPYFRYSEFMEGVKTLSSGKPFRYTEYDWQEKKLSNLSKVIHPDKLILVEGVSTMNIDLMPYYRRTLYVISDPKSESSSILTRDGSKDARLWKDLYLPSVDLYMCSKPWERADFLCKGRGA